MAGYSGARAFFDCPAKPSPRSTKWYHRVRAYAPPAVLVRTASEGVVVRRVDVHATPAHLSWCMPPTQPASHRPTNRPTDSSTSTAQAHNTTSKQARAGIDRRGAHARAHNNAQRTRVKARRRPSVCLTLRTHTHTHTHAQRKTKETRWTNRRRIHSCGSRHTHSNTCD